MAIPLDTSHVCEVPDNRFGEDELATLLPQSSVGSSLLGHKHQPHVITYNNNLSLMHGERHQCTSERVMA